MFVSYDRIAVAQALNYRVPFVFYDQLSHISGTGKGEDGHGLRGILFIDKSQTNPENVFRAVAQEWGNTRRPLPLQDTLDTWRNSNTYTNFNQKGEFISAALTYIDTKKEGHRTAVKSWSRKTTSNILVDATMRHYLGVLFCNIVVLDSHALVDATVKSFNDGTFKGMWNKSYLEAYTAYNDAYVAFTPPPGLTAPPTMFLDEPFVINPGFDNSMNTFIAKFYTWVSSQTSMTPPLMNLIKITRGLVSVVTNYVEAVNTFLESYKLFETQYEKTMVPLLEIISKDTDKNPKLFDKGHGEYKIYMKKQLPKNMYENIRRIRPSEPSQKPSKETTYSVAGSIMGQYTVLQQIIVACENTTLLSVNKEFKRRVTVFFVDLMERIQTRRNRFARTGSAASNYLQFIRSAQTLFLGSIGEPTALGQVGGAFIDEADKTDTMIKNLMNVLMMYLVQGQAGQAPDGVDPVKWGLWIELFHQFIQSAGIYVGMSETIPIPTFNVANPEPDTPEPQNLYLFNALWDQTANSKFTFSDADPPYFMKEFSLYLDEDAWQDPQWTRWFDAFFNSYPPTVAPAGTAPKFGNLLNMSVDDATGLKAEMDNIFFQDIEDEKAAKIPLDRDGPQAQRRGDRRRANSVSNLLKDQRKDQLDRGKSKREIFMSNRRGITAGGRRTRKHRKNSKKRTTKRKRSRIKRKRSRRKKNRERKKKKRTVKSR